MRKSELVKVKRVKAELVRVEPIRVHPVQVVDEGEDRRPPKSAFREALKTMAVVFWVVSGFWVFMAVLARLLGF